MGLSLSIPLKTTSIARSIAKYQKHIIDYYYDNTTAEILYDKDTPQYLILKADGSKFYTFLSDEIENIHTVVETRDIIIETKTLVIMISASVDILSKAVRQSSDCQHLFNEVKGYTTTFSKKI